MQELNMRQIDDAITLAVRKHIPLTLSINNGGWVNFHSRFIAIQDTHVLLEPPYTNGEESHEFSPAEKVSFSFKLKHHKYLSDARMAGLQEITLEDGSAGKALALCFPMRMQRVQRRSFTRIAVPPGRIVRVSFWAGDKDNEPTSPTDGRPVWSGSVIDLSAGGFCCTVTGDKVPFLKEGQYVGVRIGFGPGQESIYSDAHFRHCDTSGQKNSLGFQFLGLAHTADGREVLRTIGQKMCQFAKSVRSVG